MREGPRWMNLLMSDIDSTVDVNVKRNGMLGFPSRVRVMMKGGWIPC